MRSDGASRSSIRRRRPGRQTGRRAQLVQHAVPGAARPGEGPALRLLRRGLRLAEYRQHDRRRAGEECVTLISPRVRGEWRAKPTGWGARLRSPMAPARSPTPVVHRDHLWDVVYRRGQVVPERHRPSLEGGRRHADRSAGESELAVFADHAAAFHVFNGQLGKTRVDASEQHRLVISFRAERERGKRRQHPGAGREMQKSPPVETRPKQVAAARARRRMNDGL